MTEKPHKKSRDYILKRLDVKKILLLSEKKIEKFFFPFVHFLLHIYLFTRLNESLFKQQSYRYSEGLEERRQQNVINP